jgi:hypothetical protein
MKALLFLDRKPLRHRPARNLGPDKVVRPWIAKMREAVDKAGAPKADRKEAV